MTALERRAVFSLAGIFGLRIFGLFLILPVFALYATGLEQATPFLIGLTLGAYGLTQALLQIPFGVLSDRWDRKKAIILGLLIFALGSIIAGLAESIYGVLAGRLIQGAGAISAAVIALLADLTREEQRTKAMAVIGVGIGFIFMASMILGPVFDQWVGVKGIFYLTAVASILAIPVLLRITPEPKRLRHAQSAHTIRMQIAQVVRNPQLLQLDFGIFALHAVLTSIFVVLPFTLIDLGGLEKSEHWKVYSSVMVLGVIGMLPFMAVSHQREKTRGAMQ
ncbi:MAG: MFS transporter, partial [Proteobacteria bacterium]|nr:MFS transporter [Pseudomonadota bacterium]